MILNDIREIFIRYLYDACLVDIAFLMNNLSNESIFSYAIYCDNEFVGFSSAACTTKWLEEQASKLRKNYESKEKTILYVEIFAAEWNYYGSTNYQTFQNINELVDSIFSAFYDDEIEDLNTTEDSLDFVGLANFFKSNIIEAVELLKRSLCFESASFENDLLLGLQFGDTSIDECKLIIEVSEKVNSLKWHKKVLEAYS